MNEPNYVHGEPVWQDQASSDDTRAAEFYRGLFGWEIPEGSPEFGGYRNCSLNGKKVAGMGPLMAPGPAYWSVYVKVTSADEAAKLVADNGGQVIVAPMQVSDFGSMAVFLDPTGAAISAWQPGTHAGSEIHNVPGAVCWYELVTSDVEAAGKFYQAVFGWKARSHGPATGPGGYNEFKLGEKTVGGMMAKPATMPAEVPSHWAVYFAVDDADAAAARVAELGGRVMMGPTDIAPGRFAVVSDPTGATFNILKSSR